LPLRLGWEDLVIDKRAVHAGATDVVEEWLWLVSKDAEPMLPTACGDLFLRLPDGSIAFLDTYVGSCDAVALSYGKWKVMLNEQEKLEAWFRGGLIGDLLESGLKRDPGQCFSPLVPQVVNGSWEPSNFHVCDLLVHLSTLGQIHRQVKDLPPGTNITGFNVVWD
jgi:hypothetical protein